MLWQIFGRRQLCWDRSFELLVPPMVPRSFPMASGSLVWLDAIGFIVDLLLMLAVTRPIKLSISSCCMTVETQLSKL